MNRHGPNPGAYRKLFERGLNALIATGQLTDDEKRDAEEYLEMLKNNSYKFGKFTSHSGDRSWAPGELFMSAN